MSEFASHASDYSLVEQEPPEQSAKNIRTGTHLWASATAFFFIGFVFAYFYLRSLNNSGMWRPKGVGPSITLGTLFTVCILGASAALWFGFRDQEAGRRPQWRLKGLVALGLLFAALGLQIAAWATQGFGPTDGGYASVYVGWTAMLFVFIVGTAFWLETVVATAIRYRKLAVGDKPPAGHASGDPHRKGQDIADPLSLLRAQLESLVFYTQVISVIAVISWIILYLV